MDTKQTRSGPRRLTVLGVDYTHCTADNGDDIYSTKFGEPYIHNFLSRAWYENRRTYYRWEKLSGTGEVYRIHTRPTWNIDIVVKYSRIGQEVPGLDPEIYDEFINAEFNSPFEEFALLMEMRNTRYESPGTIRTHKPLAVYVPETRIDPQRCGRKGYIFRPKAKKAGIELDLSKNYILVYEWVKGSNAAEASAAIDMNSRDLEKVTVAVEKDLMKKGFMDHDRKPHHIIVRTTPEKSLVRDRQGKLLYAYIDFERLSRTPQREQSMKQFRRSEYLRRQRDRFHQTSPHDFPPHLNQVSIMGVDYVYGKVETTGGALWVVGKDPMLFDYFLPERWRQTPRKKLSQRRQLYYTTTKDNIHLVWGVSRVGEKPDICGFDEQGKKILEHGFNSPFEEFSLAMELGKKGFPTIYPRAIYRTGEQISASPYIDDDRPYRTHEDIIMPDSRPALMQNFEYIIIWGYYNGPDELLAIRDGEYYIGINLIHARRDGIVSEQEFERLLEDEQAKLRDAGIEDLNLHAEHFMISFDPRGKIVKNSDGNPELRVCNFELLGRV
ncbi:MAG: hypothetical protein GF350_01940 [Chitinivibrionales bacterium]|nr:hypothetical protein [Chitinivibrionales bacterium]